MSFESLTDDKIAELIALSKRVKNPSAREIDDGAYLRRDYQVVSVDGNHQFRLFTRQNRVVQNDFTAGLQWLPPSSETLMLVRYNGSSHPHSNKAEQQKLDRVCHIHKATERYIRAGRKAEGYAEHTDRYRSVGGALHALVADCGIAGLSTEADAPDLFQ